MVQSLSRIQLFCDPMDCSPPGSSSMGFSRQEHWSGLPFPSPGDLPNPGIEPGSPALQADSLPSEPTGKPEKWVLSPNVGFGWLWTLVNGPSPPPQILPATCLARVVGAPLSFSGSRQPTQVCGESPWASASERHQNPAQCKPFPDNFKEDYT